jgi:hypothetical protein
MMPISLGTSDFMVRIVVGHVKFCYMLGRFRLCSRPFLNNVLGKRENRLSRTNQPETVKQKIQAFSDKVLQLLKLLNNKNTGSSETIRRTCSFFNFSDFYAKVGTHNKNLNDNFLSWLIGFIEGDGSFGSNSSEIGTNMDVTHSGRGYIEIVQDDARLLHKIRSTLGFGTVTQFTKNDRVYWRYYTSKREHVLKFVALLNGNLILEKRRTQFTQWVTRLNLHWNMKNEIKCCNLTPSLENAWLAGFIEADGGFYTNAGNEFRRGKLPSGQQRYGFFLKMYITQKGEKATLLAIRDLFGATNKLSQVTNSHTAEKYNRIEIAKATCRDAIIDYFKRYPLLGKKNINLQRWVRVHGYQQRGVTLTEKSAKKLARLVNSLNEEGLQV